MSKLGQPKEKLWTQEEDNYLREHSYMSVKELASNLDRTEAAVRGRKSKLGVKKGNCPPFTEEELELIRSWYTQGNGVDLVELAKIMNRPKTSISMKAGEMGLTKYGNFTEERKKIMTDAMNKGRIGMEHPKGFLGKHHDEKARQKMSIASRTRAANMTYEEKHEIAMKAVKTKRENGTPGNTTSNAYSRTKSGKREDLNNQFFRSAWEANVVRILNNLGVKWEYECKRFIFTENDTGVDSYQPDFYLSELDKWIEVKGWMDEKSKLRLKLFAEQYPEENNKLIVIDQNFYNLLRYTYFNLPYWEDYAKGVRPYRNNYYEKLDDKQKLYLFEIFRISND